MDVRIPFHRLVNVVDNGKAVEYDYDYQNRLVCRNDELFGEATGLRGISIGGMTHASAGGLAKIPLGSREKTLIYVGILAIFLLCLRGGNMNSRVMVMTSVLFIGVVLFALTVVLLIGYKEENQLYDDLDTIVSARYGQEYKIVVFPPMEGRFQIVNEIFFYPHENIEGTLRVKDSNLTYGLRFSYGVDPDNLTIVCAVKGEPPSGLCKIVLKKPVSASD